MDYKPKGNRIMICHCLKGVSRLSLENCCLEQGISYFKKFPHITVGLNRYPVSKALIVLSKFCHF